MESPVWTPIGSRFSMEQMTTQLSAQSRMTSISYSFHPRSDSSTRISETGERSIPLAQMVSNSSTLYAMPPPAPPRVKAGRMMSGMVPISLAISRASSMVWATPECGRSRPILSMASLKRRRSSPLSMASALAPIMRTPCLSRVPLLNRSMEQLSAVWPPRVGRSAQGCSLMMIFSTNSGVMGSM